MNKEKFSLFGISTNFKINVTINIPFWILILLLLSAYIGWEVYWYSQVGLNFIKWHTHFGVLISIWFFIALLFHLTKVNLKWKVVLNSTMLTLLAVEFLLMLTGINQIYTERRNNTYQSLFNYKSYDSVRCHTPNTTAYLTAPEYSFKRTRNQWGFSDMRFMYNTSKFLIQTYGDSFTEGDGAAFDSSYPSILRDLLGSQYQIQNFGLCGNDPVFYIPQFTKVGSQFQPKVIVLCYGTFDFTADVLSRGGIERFTATGWQTRKGPWWEVVYASSYIARLFFHAAGISYKSAFYTNWQLHEELKKLQPKWNEMFSEIARMAAQHNTKIFLFKKPERNEIENNKYEYNMSFFDTFLQQHPEIYHVDLLPAYRKAMQVEKPNATDPYYWVYDGHHNANGYRIMATIIYNELEKSKLLSN